MSSTSTLLENLQKFCTNIKTVLLYIKLFNKHSVPSYLSILTLSALKAWLKEMFDHTLCIAEDDPELDKFKELHAKDLCDLRIVPAVGCEKFAELIYNHVSKIVNNDRIWLESVEVKEQD